MMKRQPEHATDQRERNQRDKKDKQDENFRADSCDQTKQETKQEVEGDFAWGSTNHRAKTTECLGNREIFKRKEWECKIAQEKICRKKDHQAKERCAEEEHYMREEGSRRRLGARWHVPEHADHERGQHGKKNKSEDEEEQKFEADPAPGKPAISPPYRCNGGLTGGDDLDEDELEPRAEVQQDEADE